MNPPQVYLCSPVSHFYKWMLISSKNVSRSHTGELPFIGPHFPEVTLSRVCLEALWRENGRWWVCFGRVTWGKWKVLLSPDVVGTFPGAVSFFGCRTFTLHSLSPCPQAPPTWICTSRVLGPDFEDPWTVDCLLTCLPTCRTSLSPPGLGVCLARTHYLLHDDQGSNLEASPLWGQWCKIQI